MVPGKESAGDGPAQWWWSRRSRRADRHCGSDGWCDLYDLWHGIFVSLTWKSQPLPRGYRSDCRQSTFPQPHRHRDHGWDSGRVHGPGNFIRKMRYHSNIPWQYLSITDSSFHWVGGFDRWSTLWSYASYSGRGCMAPSFMYIPIHNMMRMTLKKKDSNLLQAKHGNRTSVRFQIWRVG